MLQVAVDEALSEAVVAALFEAYPTALTQMDGSEFEACRKLCQLSARAGLAAVQYMPSLAGLCDADGRTLLHTAAELDATELASALLDHNADLGVMATKEGEFPLHTACIRASSDTITPILNMAKSAAKAKWVSAAVGRCVAHCPVLTSEMVQKGALPLHLVLQGCGELQAVTDVLLEHPSACKETDADGNYPLYYACQAPTANVLMSQIGFMLKTFPGAASRLNRVRWAYRGPQCGLWTR